MSQIIKDMLEHAAETPAEEVCGLVVQYKETNKLKVIRGCNTAVEKHRMFDLDPEIWVRANESGCEPKAFYHSHPSGDVTPSDADKITAEALSLPCYIVSASSGDAGLYEPCGFSAPYKGRVFYHGVLDCYALVRDWYAGEFGIEIPNYRREWDWWEKGQNLYVDQYQDAGFYQLKEEDPLQRGDVLLMQLGAKVPNHAAVYLGNGLILQHVRDRLSGEDVYGGQWLKNTTHRLRHNSKA